MNLESKEQIEAELEQAASARIAGSEGRCRVCARRAAGIAIRRYLTLQGYSVSGKSVSDLLGILMDLPGVPEQVIAASKKLCMRVNRDYHLPAGFDLIAEARILINTLEKEY
ncbi:MAG: hypothetical protein U1B80_00590 [Anaerolineaceae bacterium]|nr:hypothetical protein [Anaerolineaceae bacterium]